MTKMLVFSETHYIKSLILHHFYVFKTGEQTLNTRFIMSQRPLEDTLPPQTLMSKFSFRAVLSKFPAEHFWLAKLSCELYWLLLKMGWKSVDRWSDEEMQTFNSIYGGKMPKSTLWYQRGRTTCMNIILIRRPGEVEEANKLSKWSSAAEQVL